MSTEMKLSDALEPVAVDSSSQLIMALARRVAATDCSVLIVGESGTGKEVLARLIHRASPRAKNSFVAVNCAAIPENMLEAMLFGYEKGSFTGAVNAHAGKFEQAQGGTILLDEITEMPLALQAKLLRVLQEREVERLGGNTPVALDVRVIATTNRLLRDEVAAGRFREDLYYRLNVFPLALTPLRERRDDILPLATHLLQQRARPGSAFRRSRPMSRTCCSPTHWPGNVRELDNLLQRAVVLVEGTVIEAEHILFEKQPTRADAAASVIAGAAADAAARRTRRDPRGAARRAWQPPRSGGEARHQPAHAALQAGAHPQRRHRRSRRLNPVTPETPMSNMEIDRVLAQIRSISQARRRRRYRCGSRSAVRRCGRVQSTTASRSC